VNTKEDLLFKEEKTDLRTVFAKIRKKWYYFAISIPLFIAGAWFYLETTVPVYKVNATVMIDDGSGSSMGTEDFFADISLFPAQENVNNEIEKLRSYSVIGSAINMLDFEVFYYKKEPLRTVELYKDTPFKIRYDSAHMQVFEEPFTVTFISENIMVLAFEAEGFDAEVPQSRGRERTYVGETYSYRDTLHVGQSTESEYFKFVIEAGPVHLKRRSFSEGNYPVYEFEMKDQALLAKKYRKELEISNIENSSVVLLEIDGEVVDKEMDFLNTLGDTYIFSQLARKTQVAASAIDFIDEQIVQITDSLQGAENQLESFRRNRNVMDINVTATNAVEQLQQLENQEAGLTVKDQYYQNLLNYLQNSDLNTIIAPSSIGIDDPLLNASIMELKQLNSEKIALSYTLSDKNKDLTILNSQIDNLRNTLIENVKNIISTSRIALSDVRKRLAEVRGTLNLLPQNERDLVKIKRKFDFSDNLYNYLLQKKAEAGIAQASSMPDHHILDSARVPGEAPVFPNKPLVYVAAFVLSIMVPGSLIVIGESLNNKITGADHLQTLTNISLLGTVPRDKEGESSIINAPHSALNEAFRSLRVNLRFLASGDRKVLGLTSTVSGEGKTFCAFNLSVTLAMSGKRTVVIEGDLRKPKLSEKFKPVTNGYAKTLGLTNYLIGSCAATEIIQQTHVENLDIISAGPTPPNPTELLESSAFVELIKNLRAEYDYIVIDSAPVGLVADYYIMSQVVDVTLYVTRQGYSQIKFMNDLNQIQEDARLKNLYLVLNDVDQSNMKYGYGGYGYYGEDPEKKPSKKRKNIFQKAK